MSPVRVTKPSGYRLWRPLVVVSAILALSGLTACSAESTSAEGAGEKTMQSAAPSPTWTPNTPKKAGTPTSDASAEQSAAPEEYTMPKNAKPAKDMVDNFFANYTIDDISNMRPLGETLRHSEERLTETAQLLGAIHVNALEAYEQAQVGTGSELDDDNTIFRDPQEMAPEELAQALNAPLYYAMLQATDKDLVTGGMLKTAPLDVDRAKKLACLHLCSGSSNQWVRFRDFLDGYSPYKEKPEVIDTYISVIDENRPTATITETRTVSVGDLGDVTLATIQRKGDNLQPEREWEEKWLFVPYSALPELPGIDGTSAIRSTRFDDPIDFNRPKVDDSGNYGSAVVAILLQ